MKLIEHMKNVRGEMKHVSWPTRKQALAFTIFVIILSLLTGVYLGLFDFIFSRILQDFII